LLVESYTTSVTSTSPCSIFTNVIVPYDESNTFVYAELYFTFEIESCVPFNFMDILGFDFTFIYIDLATSPDPTVTVAV
jgi:hypothetical protein